MHYYFQAWRNCFDWYGRSSRTEFWAFIIVNTLIGIVIDSIEKYVFFNIAGEILSKVYWVIMIIPALTIAVRRLHDSNRTGWWLLINFIPYLGGMVFFVLMALPSGKKNKYGAKPRHM